MALIHIATQDGGKQVDLLLVCETFVSPLHSLVSHRFPRLLLILSHQWLQLLVRRILLEVPILDGYPTCLRLIDGMLERENDLLEVAVADWSVVAAAFVAAVA